MVIELTVKLEPHEAAALARLCEKFSHGDADRYLYPHVTKEVRSEQSYHMVRALARLDRALDCADVRSWPWIETGLLAGERA